MLTWLTWYERLVKKSATHSTSLKLLSTTLMSPVPRLPTLMPALRRRKESPRRSYTKVGLRSAQCGPKWV